jgi:tartrate-resistant acid phosphatase type 5
MGDAPNSPKRSRLSRRRFLKNTFAFSAAASLTGCGWGGIAPVAGVADPVVGGVAHILMVGDWGTAISFEDQAEVAAAMKAYDAKYNLSTDALLMLGDNFYGDMTGGVASPRWESQFEQMYPPSVFKGPAYAVPGNHDYQNAPDSKYTAELAYAQGVTRWTMPSRYYRFTFPAVNPTITFIALDSNMPNEPAQPFPPDSSYYTPSDTDRQVQLDWLTSQLQEPLTTPFLVVAAHHPLYSNGPHGDNQTLIRDWDPLLRASKAHLYLAGHDHDLQHLEFAGHPTSFLLSGGGGAALDLLKTNKAARTPFAQEVHGFSHIQVRPDLMTLRHLDTQGNLLHKFTKTPDGVVTILK